MMYRRCMVRFSAAAALSAALVSMPGCGDSDGVQAELERAEIVLTAISNPGSTARPPDDRRRDDLQWVIDRLSGRPGKGVAYSLLRPEDFDRRLDDPQARPKPGAGALPEPRSAAVDANQPGQAAAANMLVSRAHAGLGEIQANAHARVEAALLNQLAVIRAALGEWNALNSQAAGFETYDAEADVRSLQSQMTERQSELGQAQQASRAAVDAIAALEAEASQLSAQGEQARQRETAVRERMLNASETERLRLLEEATRHRREADDFDRQAAVILARAEADRPNAATLARRVSLIESQITFLRDGVASVRERGDKNLAAATRARADAAQVAARLDTLITEAATLRANADAPADEAVRLYGLAQSAATKAASKATDAATKGQASVLAAAAAQAAADVQASRARGLTQYATVVRSAADDPFRLPNRATYSQRAGEAEKRSADAQKLAGELYKAAMDSFGRAGTAGAGAQGQALKQRLDSLGKQLSVLAGEAPVPTNEPADQAPSAPTADSSSSDDSPEIAEARAFMQRLIDQTKAGNLSAMLDAMAFEDPAEAELVRAIFPLVQAVADFNSLCESTYGSDLAALVQASKVPAVRMNPMLSMIGPMTGQMGAMGAGLGDLRDLTAADLTFSPMADGKIAFLGGEEGAEQPGLLAKIDGQWRLWFPRTGMASGPGAGQAQMFLPMFKPMAGVFGTVGGKVRSGDYANADAMLTDLAARLTGAMAMPGMNGDDDDPDTPVGGGVGGGMGGG
ncbi:MAG: hypothetical protein KF768_03450 [Phycisphaeraceae bacterium]|nr:hypothetical protein [Phycisphaeraceae bacterium]